MIEAYPLCWPVNKPRIPKAARQRAKFGTKEMNSLGWKTTKSLSVAQAVDRVLLELDRFTKVGRNYRVPKNSIVISTNIPVSKNTGLPYSDRAQPEDVGVAVYFTLDNRSYCCPCDAWDRVADNLAAVAAHLYSLRAIERYKVGESHDVFTGHLALPSSAPRKRTWFEVLRVPDNATYAQAEAAYRRLRIELHPDKPGGSHEAFIELREAWATVEKHLKP